MKEPTKDVSDVSTLVSRKRRYAHLMIDNTWRMAEWVTDSPMSHWRFTDCIYPLQNVVVDESKIKEIEWLEDHQVTDGCNQKDSE